MQIQKTNNQQSFGMAWEVNAKSLINADPEELKSFKELIDRNSKALDVVTKNFDTLIGAVVKNGKITKIGAGSKIKPTNINDCFACLRKYLFDSLLSPIKEPKFVKKIETNGIIDSKLDSKFVSMVSESVKGADERFRE